MSYQRDLFDTQMDLMDQLHEQRSALWAGQEQHERGSLGYAIARGRRLRQLEGRRTQLRRGLFGAEDRGRGAQCQRLIDRTQGEIDSIRQAMADARRKK